MTLKHIKIFVTVCECDCCITKAAKKLFLAQPSISLAIKELEAYYNQPLFERLGRKLYLTPVGQKLLIKAEETLKLVDEMDLISSNQSHFTTLHIGSSITIGTHFLPSIVLNFNSKNPYIPVRVKVNNSREIEDFILSNKIDLGFIEGVVHSDQIVSIPFMDDHLEVICGYDHPFASRNSLTLEEIQSQPFALREVGSASRDFLDYTMAAHGFHINPIWECISTQSIVQAVKKNLCLSFLPQKMIQDELNSHNIKAIKVDDLELRRQHYIIYHKNKHVTKAMEDFMGIAKEIVQ
jgi:DNA-binding transcriptional LysR family regulator